MQKYLDSPLTLAVCILALLGCAFILLSGPQMYVPPAPPRKCLTNEAKACCGNYCACRAENCGCCDGCPCEHGDRAKKK